MSERRIGKVINVDSFRVIIELDDIIKGSYKNSYYNLFEIAKINSYIIIPVADEKIVAMITRVKINDETEIETSSGNISLPKSKRYVIATMIGTITGNIKKEYIQGVYNFPILDNSVWYVMNEDLQIIFDYNHNLDDSYIDFNKDYFLPIGNSPVFTDFDVKINPDMFFSKHAAILGNTGSGKSCTVSTIIQSIFENKYKYKNEEGIVEEGYVENANFIIFDTNGEYKNAFNFENKDIKDRVNTFTINNEGLKVPYWFMNYEDFDYLFKPSANTQSPILKRAIELAKNETEVVENGKLSRITINLLNHIMELCVDYSKEKEFFKALYYNLSTLEQIDFLKDTVPDIKENINLKSFNKNGETIEYLNFSKPEVKIKFKETLYNTIKSGLDKLYNEESEKRIEERNINIPKWFNFRELSTKYIDKAIEEQESSNNRINEFLSTLRLRLNSFYNDERYSNPFLLNNSQKNDLLSEFIQYILGVLESDDDNIYSKYKFEQNASSNFKNIYDCKNKNQITIIDMSLLPHEVLDNVTGLIGRLILEFLTRLEKAGIKRGAYPTVMVLEEAQNYIPEKDKDSERVSISKKVFEKIAREGRKYGLSLVVSSQRPFELSKTILSQCNSFIVHRIQNPDDQKYIRQLVSAANEDILNQLPVLPQQHAIVMGEAVRSPIQVKLRDVNPKPNSENPEYFNNWINTNSSNKLTKDRIKDVTDIWLGKIDK